MDWLRRWTTCFFAKHPLNRLRTLSFLTIPPCDSASLQFRSISNGIGKRSVAHLCVKSQRRRISGYKLMVKPDDAGPLIGRRLGVYDVQALVGAGGMGEVYRARDTRLGRDIAVKILPSHFIADPERRARFEREARTLASLNHPHIAAIYGVEEADGVFALVLELVEGDTLADRVHRGPIPVAEALRIARQIADALDAAHEKRIVHRDLKPANVKITPDGTVKVLDFGLAKAAGGDDSSSPDLSESPTVTVDDTRAGLILGTVGYMSPEQARGKPVDRRTDIWAFGCVLFEMLSGRMPFSGDTMSDTIAAILEHEPPWDRLPNSVPPAVHRLLQRCLEKDPKRRLRDIGDARMDLDEALSGPAENGLAGREPGKMTRRTAIAALAGAAAGVAGTGAFAISRYRGPVRRNLTQFAIPMPDGTFHPTSFNGRVAISPDGTRIAFNAASSPGSPASGLGGAGFYLRLLGELESKRVKDVLGGGAGPFFSPDGRWIGYLPTTGGRLAGGIRKLPLGGGASVPVCDLENFFGATWADDDVIYFVPEFPAGVARVPAAGGEPKELVAIDFAKGERNHKYPHALPGGKAVLFTTVTSDSATYDDARIVVFSTQTGRKTILVEGGTCPRFSPSGHLLYARDGKIFAVRFDIDRLETKGQAVPVLEGVHMSRNTGVANYDVSATGDLVYVPGNCDGGARTLVWVDRNGKAEPVPLAAKSYLHPRLSPDDRRLAIEIEGPSHDLHVYDFNRTVLTNLTTDGVSHWPVWSPDGTELGFRSGPMSKFKLWRVRADRSSPPKLLPAVGTSQSAESWSPDGRAIAYTAVARIGAPASIMVAPLDGSGKAEPFAGGTASEGSSKFSPDGRWLAYCSNESGTPQVYVQAFPGPGAKIQISNEGGTDPVWKRAGGELFYRNGDSMMVVSVTTAPSFTASRPQELWKGHYSHGMSSSCGAPGATSSNYDVTADGQRFLMIRDNDQDSTTSKQMVVVLGWADEVSRAVARS
jgi:Tol biopolymer transport system component